VPRRHASRGIVSRSTESVAASNDRCRHLGARPLWPVSASSPSAYRSLGVRSPSTPQSRERRRPRLPDICPGHLPNDGGSVATPARTGARPDWMEPWMELWSASSTSSSLAIRSSPHNGFSVAIRRIRLRSSGGIGGRSTLHFPRQKDPPTQSAPANNRRRPYDDDRSAPIEHSREQCDADASGAIHASGFDTALDITRELLAKNQILRADRVG
jgi:hypothetical protein